MIKKVILLCALMLATLAQAQAQEQRFEESFNLIHDMLQGKRAISFKQAVFSVEDAYLNGKMDTATVNRSIKSLSGLAEALRSQGELQYAEKDKETISGWAAIFKVMSDTVPLVANGKEYLHLPFRYDFEDPFGKHDWSKMFVSTLLINRKGNCHSLPYLYKILAEQIGVQAHLALAPNHIYIKHKSLRDGWYNTELTSGIFPVDAWLMASGYVHIDAVSNGVFMKALNDRECLALVLADLAQGYQRKFPSNDGAFITKCADVAISVYPNFATALLLKAEVNKVRATKEIDVAKRKSLMERLAAEYMMIHELGYRAMPEQMYLNWLVSLRSERDRYENKKLNTFIKQ